jgi:uncharacterized protein
MDRLRSSRAKEATMAYNVLSIDGGGIRGLIPVILLQRLSNAAGLNGWLDNVHLLAGTSTGGLIALGLAAGKTLDELRALYVKEAAHIFDDSFLDNVKDVGKLLGADYDTKNLREVVERTLGAGKKLDQLGKRVLITAFDLDDRNGNPAERSWKPKLFHNFPGVDSDGAALAANVALYTSAAPTYFPTVDGYVDGGVFAPNPSMCALAQTQDTRTKENVDLSDVRLLSLGTGQSLLHVEGTNLDWGYAQWAKPLVDILMDGVSGIAHFQCKQILRNRYSRLAPVFPAAVTVPMDAWKKLDFMTEFAEKVDLTATITWIRENWNR